MTHYLHHVPGRLRIRSVVTKRNPASARKVRALLGQLDGVDEVDVREVTGSITVRYDTDIVSMQDIVGVLKAHGLVASDAPVESMPAGAALSPRSEAAARRVGSTAMEIVLERSATALLAALI